MPLTSGMGMWVKDFQVLKLRMSVLPVPITRNGLRRIVHVLI